MESQDRLTALIGKVVPFHSQPYHSGTLTITAIEPSKNHPNRFVVTGDGTGTETSRLFSASSTKPKSFFGHRIYSFSIDEIEAAANGGPALIHVYPV